MNFKEQNKNMKRPWAKYYSSPELAELEYPEGTLYDALKDTVLKYPKETAVDYMGVRFTYKELDEYIIRCSEALYALGARPGDRITVCLPNIPQAVIVFYAVIRIGAVANMIHPLSAGSEIEFFVNKSKSNMLFIFDAFFGKTASVNCPTLRKRVFAGAADMLPFFMRAYFNMTDGRAVKRPAENDSVLSWGSFMSAAGTAGSGHDDILYRNAGYTDTAVILYSGGTTGTNKGICLSHLNFNALACQTAAVGADSILPGDTMLAVLPMFHGFGLGVCVHTVICKGGTVILVPRFNADSFADLLRKKKPRFIAGVPTLYEALLRKDRLKGVDFTHIKGVYSGGDTLPPDIKLRFDKALKERGASVTLREGFGLTECVTASALTPENEYRRRSVGIPYSDTFYKITAPGSEEELPAGTDGEICISGPTVMNGYLDDVNETANVLRKDSDGRIWLHTGDLGCMDADGFVYFKSRLKRMVKCSGYSVYPSQLEAVINAHEAVSVSCVIGIHDDYKMSRLKAFIVLKDGMELTPELEVSIKEHCRNNIAAYAMPKEFVFRDSLPLTNVGKVAYTLLEKEENENVKEQKM